MQTNFPAVYINGGQFLYGFPYEAQSTISERVYLPIAPESPAHLDSHFGSGLIKRTANAPRDELPFTPILRHYHDDSLSFGGYPGKDFLIRSPK